MPSSLSETNKLSRRVSTLEDQVEILTYDSFVNCAEQKVIEEIHILTTKQQILNEEMLALKASSCSRSEEYVQVKNQMELLSQKILELNRMLDAFTSFQNQLCERVVSVERSLPTIEDFIAREEQREAQIERERRLRAESDLLLQAERKKERTLNLEMRIALKDDILNALVTYGPQLYHVLGGRPLFIDRLIGKNLILSHNDGRVFNSSKGKNIYSFVAVNYPLEGEVVFTLKTSPKIDMLHSRIGFFNVSTYAHSKSSSFVGLYLLSTSTSLMLTSGKGKAISKTLNENDFVLLTFSKDQVSFQVPSIDFSEIMDIPRNDADQKYIFGLDMLFYGEAWEVALLL
ncbi:hypothetical protein RCL1_007698 [Eukaryota sp. TZLM3-RCL]